MKYLQYRLGPFVTSNIELVDILKSWIAVSLAFGIVLTSSPFSFGKFITILIISSLTVGIGFIFHEMAHKLLAQHYGCFAEFRSYDPMLILAIIFSFFGFVFAAPGAVMISGPIGIRRNGKISLAGPLTNLIIGLIFAGIILIGAKGIFLEAARYGFIINVFIAAFNLTPIWNFDGLKIWKWNKPVYLIMIAICFVLIFFSEKITSLKIF